MFKIGEIVSYSATGVCEIIDIRYEKLTDREMQYYILKPMYQNSSTVYVPVENETLVSRIKRVMTTVDAEKLLDALSSNELEWIENDTERLSVSREILRLGDRMKIAALIKCLYLRGEALSAQGKHLRTADAQIFKEAQLILHGELATVLDIPLEDVEDFISKHVNKTAEK